MNTEPEVPTFKEWTYNYESGYWAVCEGYEIIRGKRFAGRDFAIAMTEKSAKAICDEHNAVLRALQSVAPAAGVSAQVHVQHYFPKGYNPNEEPWKSITVFVRQLELDIAKLEQQVNRRSQEIEQLEKDKERLNAALDAATDVGIYPKSVVGGDKPYEKRTDWMEGWNAALMEVQRIVVESLGQQGESK